MTRARTSGGKRPRKKLRRRVDAAARRARALELLGQGMTPVAVARTIGVARKTVHRYAAEASELADAIRRRPEDVARILRDAAPEAAERLYDLLGEKDAKVVLGAAKAVLDRAGHGPGSKIEHTFEPPSDKRNALERLERIVAKLRDEVAAEPHVLEDESPQTNGEA